MKYYYGIDLGGTDTKIGLFSETIEMIDSFIVPTPQENQNETVFKKIKSNLIENASKNNISLENILGIGIAVPGPVKNGIGISFPNLDFCKNKDVKKEMEEMFGGEISIGVGNDASLAAFGEYKVIQPEHRNIVFYTLGTGVGGGLIINGEIVEGLNGIAGEFGHIQVENNFSKQCGCGGYGCLEQFSSSKAIVEYYCDLCKDKKKAFDKGSIEAKIVFDLAKKGDSMAIETIDRMAKYIAMSAANMAVICDPEVFVIGGGISNAGDFLINKIRAFYEKNARFNGKNTSFVIAKLGNDAGMYGAAYLVKIKGESDEYKQRRIIQNH